jgi:bacterioferritin-associated ferredoxin
MENTGSGAEDVADADLRETTGIAGESGDCGRQARVVAAGRAGRTVHQY